MLSIKILFVPYRLHSYIRCTGLCEFNILNLLLEQMLQENSFKLHQKKPAESMKCGSKRSPLHILRVLILYYA